jgi:hypothetical protein
MLFFRLTVSTLSSSVLFPSALDRVIFLNLSLVLSGVGGIGSFFSGIERLRLLDRVRHCAGDVVPEHVEG